MGLPMEAETMGILVGGFAVVMGFSSVIVGWLWYANRQRAHRRGYGWIMLHFALFSVGVFDCLQAIGFDYMVQTTAGMEIHGMASEEISLRLGIAGLFWACSMACLLKGIVALTQRDG